MNKYDYLLGREIVIEELADANGLDCAYYKSKRGTVLKATKDPWGEDCLVGSWGYVTIYPDRDKISLVK